MERQVVRHLVHSGAALEHAGALRPQQGTDCLDCSNTAYVLVPLVRMGTDRANEALLLHRRHRFLRGRVSQARAETGPVRSGGDSHRLLQTFVIIPTYVWRKIGSFRWFMSPQHIGPTEAVEVHKLVGAKKSVGIHWGTYSMGSYEVRSNVK